MKKILFASFYVIILIHTNHIYGQALCGEVCNDLEIVVPGCDYPINVFDYIDGEECGISMYDFEGNPLDFPLSINKYTACRKVRIVTNNGNGAECEFNLTLKVIQNISITPVPISSISMNNYISYNIPRPIVSGDCIDGIRVTDSYDEFISICREVPRIRRKWVVFDQCNNSATATQEFNLVGNLPCTIIGADKLVAGYPNKIRSHFNPRQQFESKIVWQIKGDGWKIDQDKLHPFEITVTPPPVPGSALITLDIFDAAGCARHCERVFRSAIFNGRTNEASNDFQEEPTVEIRPKSVYLWVPESNTVKDVMIMDIMGQIHFNKKLDISGGGEEIYIDHLVSGTYYIRLKTSNNDYINKAFIKY